MPETFFKIMYEERRGEREYDRDVLISAKTQEQAVYDFLPPKPGYVVGPDSVSCTIDEDGKVIFNEEKSTAIYVEDEDSVWDDDMILSDIYVLGPFVKTKCETCGSEVLKADV